MKILKSGGFALIFLLAIAAGLRLMYPPVPREIKSLVRISGDTEAGNMIFNTRLPLFENSWLQIVGAVDERPETIEVIRSYFDANQRSDAKFGLVLTGSSAIDRTLKGVEHTAIKIDASNLATLQKTLLDAHLRNLRVLLILSSPDATHRMGQSVATYLENQFSMQIPVAIITDLALTEDAEVSLKPECLQSPYSQDGLVFDLGCTILSLSKRAQVEKPGLDQDLISIEEESANEELIAIYRPRR